MIASPPCLVCMGSGVILDGPCSIRVACIACGERREPDMDTSQTSDTLPETAPRAGFGNFQIVHMPPYPDTSQTSDTVYTITDADRRWEEAAAWSAMLRASREWRARLARLVIGEPDRSCYGYGGARGLVTIRRSHRTSGPSRG